MQHSLQTHVCCDLAKPVLVNRWDISSLHHSKATLSYNRARESCLWLRCCRAGVARGQGTSYPTLLWSFWAQYLLWLILDAGELVLGKDGPCQFYVLHIWSQQMGEWINGGREFQGTTGHPPGKALQPPQNNPQWFHTEGPRACEAGLILEHASDLLT